MNDKLSKPTEPSPAVARPWECNECHHVVGHIERRERVDWFIYHGPYVMEAAGRARVSCQVCGSIVEWQFGEDALKALLDHHRRLRRGVQGLGVLMLLFFLMFG